jgi:hypothetical protein
MTTNFSGGIADNPLDDSNKTGLPGSKGHRDIGKQALRVV